MRALVLAVLFASSAAAQQTWYVDAHAATAGSGSATDPFKTIQAAIVAPTTSAGDTVLVRSGVYAEHVAYVEPLNIRSVDGPLSTVIRCAAGGPTVRGYQDNSLLEGFTLFKTQGTHDDEVVDMAGLTLRRCIVVAQSTLCGVMIDWGTVDHCLITGAYSAFGFTSYATADIRNSILWGNNHSVVISGEDEFTWFQYCVVDEISGENLTTNIEGPPLVRSYTSGDYHLRSTSPCIDAGDPFALPDPDGSRSDIGPLPFIAGYEPFSTYCTAKVNSLGCTPSIDASGNASSSAPVPFNVTCVNELNSRSGLLFYGFAPANTTYQGGYFCVAPPVRRTQLLDSGGNSGPDDCSGVYSFDFNSYIQSGADTSLEPGVGVFAQYWSRDPAASFHTNRSNAISFTILP